MLGGEHIGPHVQLDHIQHIAPELLLPGDAGQEGFRRGQTRLLVAERADTASAVPPGGIGLAEVVAQCGKHQFSGVLCLGAQGCGPVQHQHGVVPDVPLGVKSWLLGHADQGLHLGKPDAQLLHLPQGFEEYGGPGRFQKGLFQLGHDPLPGEGGQIHGFA